MDSLDAMCLLMELGSAGDVVPPDQWCLLPDGSLTFRFSTSPNTFTWGQDEVAMMAARWRALERPVPAGFRRLVDGHGAFVRMLDEGDFEAPDRVFLDVPAEVLHAFWDDPKVAIRIGPEDLAEAA